jgi:hypothetical protein
VLLTWKSLGKKNKVNECYLLTHCTSTTNYPGKNLILKKAQQSFGK